MKKLINSLLGIVLCLFLSANVFAQDANSDFGSGSIVSNVTNTIVSSPDATYYDGWYPTGSFPNIPTATYFTESAILGDTLYAHLPDGTGAGTTTFIKYKINTAGTGGGSWITTGSQLPGTATGGAMVACGGKIYYIAGGTTSVTTGGTAVYCYSPTTGTWTTKAPLPIARSAHGAVCWGDSVILVMGGPYSTSPTTNLEVFVYRPTPNTWTTLTAPNALPSGAGRRAFGIGLFGNKIIIAGGYAGAFLKSAYVGTLGSTANQITWVAAPDIPTTESGLSRMGGTACNGHFFTIGGERGSSTGYNDITYVFNFQSNTWVHTFTSLKPTATSNIWNGCSSKLYSGDTTKIFTVGAYNAAASNVFEVAKFKPTWGVGLKDINNAYLVSVYPNPANSIINIALGDVNGTITAEIININGQLVSKKEIITGNNLIDISSLAKGVYFVTIKGNQLLLTEKIIVQ